MGPYLDDTLCAVNWCKDTMAFKNAKRFKLEYNPRLYVNICHSFYQTRLNTNFSPLIVIQDDEIRSSSRWQATWHESDTHSASPPQKQIPDRFALVLKVKH